MLEGLKVLYISYNGMLDPLGQSQVLPYLRGLAARGVLFTLLSFERSRAFTSEGRRECEQLRSELKKQNIEWHRRRYHQRLSLAATTYDVLGGIREARSLAKRNNVELVHARSHIPATIALAVKKATGAKMIFDVRGLMADEYADAGHWRHGDFKFRLTKRMERRCFAGADGIVTLTSAIWPIIREWEGLGGRDVTHEVIPCCADLDRFRFDAGARERIRRELNIDDKFVLVYSGSIGGWYLIDEMADFFAMMSRERADAHMLWLTQTSHEEIRAMMRTREIDASRYSIRASRPGEVAGWLSASDAGLAFIKPCFSKLASSPTKNAEYLGCGLPLIINAGVGDSDSLVEREHAGVLVRHFRDEDYREACARIAETSRDVSKTRAGARAVATRVFDLNRVGVEAYARLYDRVMAATGIRRDEPMTEP